MTTAKAAQPLRVHYDEGDDVLTVEGVPYSGAIFRAWSVNGFPTGTVFRVLERSMGGVLVVEELHLDEARDA